MVSRREGKGSRPVAIWYYTNWTTSLSVELVKSGQQNERNITGESKTDFISMFVSIYSNI